MIHINSKIAMQNSIYEVAMKLFLNEAHKIELDVQCLFSNNEPDLMYTEALIVEF